MKRITHKIRQFCSMFHASCSMKNGYTIVEVLVAVAIFTLVIAAPTGFLVSAVKAQQKALLSQKAMNEMSYALEYMSRLIRMAKKELSNNNCLSTRGLNYEMIDEESKKGLKFINYHGECQEFFLDTNDNLLKEIKKKGGRVFSLTSVEISSFEIESHGDSWAQTVDGYLDYNQPKVTIFLEIKGIIQIQTTISQRNLDIAY